MVGRRARLELQMQVAVRKVMQLVEENGAKFGIPPNIGGTMTKVANSNYLRTMRISRRVTHIIDGSPLEVLLTDSEQTDGPRNSSQQSLRIDLHEAFEEPESSDYVSTLMDPHEAFFQ